VSPFSLLPALVPIQPSPFGKTDAILSQLFDVDELVLSFNPSPLAVALGPAATPFYIPGGMMIEVTNLWLFDFIHVQTAYLTLMPTSGVAAGMSLGPLNFLGLFTINCGLCATPKTGGPSIALSLTADERSFMIIGGISLFAGKPPFGTSIIPAQDMPPQIDFSIVLAFVNTAFDITATLRSPSILKYGEVSLEASGDMEAPDDVEILFSLQLNQAALQPIIAPVQEAIGDIMDFVQDLVDACNVNVGNSKKAFENAQAELAAASGGIQKRFDAQKKKVDDKQAVCDEYGRQYDQAKDKCSWKSPGKCAMAAGYKVSKEGCEGVLNGYKDVLNNMEKTAQTAVAVAQDSVKATQAAVSAATSVLNLAQTLSSKIDLKTPFSVQWLKIIVSIGGDGGSLAVKLSLTLNGKPMKVGFTVSAPGEISDISDSLVQTVRDWFEDNILKPYKADFIAKKLGLESL
jgi:hypothetical protein